MTGVYLSAIRANPYNVGGWIVRQNFTLLPSFRFPLSFGFNCPTLENRTTESHS